MKKIISILILLTGGVIFPQVTGVQGELLKEAIANIELLNTNQDKAFLEAEKIEKEANKIGAREAELRSIATQCEFYKNTNDLNNLLIKAKLLLKRANLYNDSIHKVYAHLYAFEAYLANELFAKALSELNMAQTVIEKIHSQEPIAKLLKSFIFISYANYYQITENNKKRIQYLKLAVYEIQNIESVELKRRHLYNQYSNLALSFYIDEKMDSAEYYLNLSDSNNSGDENIDNQFVYYLIMGGLEKERNSYESANFYLNKAEKLAKSSNYLNILYLYENKIDLYEKLNEKERANNYKVKIDSLKLSVSESKNKTLHNILTESDISAKKRFVFFGIIIIVLIMALIFSILNREKIIRKQEKISENYLRKYSLKQNSENFSQLIEMLKNNDKAFMILFSDVFPNFSEKLLKINPKLSPSDIEFCAFLKLKLSTKDIAKYKFMEPQSVRNRKYSLRKKIAIPKGVDIYQFIEFV